ncbi:MAG: hypothetical protein E5Y35_26270, partial [Mesorhizobium sp.]
AFTGAPSHDALKCLTLCVLVLRNGYTVTGESACASPENFDAELGYKIARENARKKIWALEGYRLRSELADRELRRRMGIVEAAANEFATSGTFGGRK